MRETFTFLFYFYIIVILCFIVVYILFYFAKAIFQLLSTAGDWGEGGEENPRNVALPGLERGIGHLLHFPHPEQGAT